MLNTIINFNLILISKWSEELLVDELLSQNSCLPVEVEVVHDSLAWKLLQQGTQLLWKPGILVCKVISDVQGLNPHTKPVFKEVFTRFNTL